MTGKAKKQKLKKKAKKTLKGKGADLGEPHTNMTNPFRTASHITLKVTK